LGLVWDGEIRDVTGALDVLGEFRYPLPVEDPMIANLGAVIERATAIAGSATPVPVGDCALLSPVANPSKVIGAPVNYQKHLEEARSDPELHHNNQIAAIQRAGLFLKASSSLVGPSQGIRLRRLDRRNDHEVELAVIIGKTADRVGKENALDYVAGYAIGLDITIRGPEERCLRKSVDTYSVLGPWLVTADEIADPNHLGLTIAVNGETRQDSNTSLMVLNVPELIEFASSFYSLLPGDVIMTGTPEGVSAIVPGDTIRAEIEKIGVMDVQVEAA
jgi:2-keto-4-pentenoate hydratase/2-oxohepta-3-ene-1,7-dioic acid hydratase in catechol pathway